VANNRLAVSKPTETLNPHPGSQADDFCFLIVLLVFFGNLASGVVYGALGERFLWGAACLLPTALARFARPNSGISMAFISIGLFTSLAAWVRPDIETLALHAVFLLGMPCLLVYGNWRPLCYFALTWGLSSLLYAGNSESSLPVPANQYLSFIVLQTLVLVSVARYLANLQLQAKEAQCLLGRLSSETRIDLTRRATSEGAATKGVGSPSVYARIFDQFADNMTRIVAAFNMLKEDMLHLSEIAGRLRQKAAVQKERSEIGAEQVGLIYESNDKLSSRGEAVAQTARGGFDTAQRILEAAQQYESEMQTVRERVQTGRDHIDKLFHKLVQVKAAMTAVRNITEKISAVSQAKNTSETQVEDMLRLARLGEEATLQYDHMEVTVEELTTAIYNITQVMTLFQEKVEMSFNMTRQISKSTHALQEENSSTAQAIEDMVMEMHKNQRQAMDLLSSLEFARNASQEAIGVLESSARHIVRTEQLVGEMETRLMRFNV